MPLSNIPNVPVMVQDNVRGKQPSIWAGLGTAFTSAPFTQVAVGSLYTDLTGGTAKLYQKYVHTGAGSATDYHLVTVA